MFLLKVVSCENGLVKSESNIVLLCLVFFFMMFIPCWKGSKNNPNNKLMWREVPFCEGEYTLYQILHDFPEAAHPAKRDVAPLRLVSWLSCHLGDNAQTLIEKTMKEFSIVEAVHSERKISWGYVSQPSWGPCPHSNAFCWPDHLPHVHGAHVLHGQLQLLNVRPFADGFLPLSFVGPPPSWWPGNNSLGALFS